MGIFITSGDSNSEGSNFYTLFPNELDQRWAVRCGAINPDEKQSGSDIVEAYARFKASVLDKNPTAVSIMFGTNDQMLDVNGVPKVSLVVFEDYLNRMVTHLVNRGVKVLLMTAIPFHVTTFHNRIDPLIKEQYLLVGGVRKWANRYNGVIRKVAAERGVAQRVYLVDNYANAWEKAAPGDGSAGDAELAASGLVDSTGNHWTPKGHGMITYSVNHYLAK